MKVLTLWSSHYKGGCSRRFVELVDGLSSRGTEVVLLSVHSYPGCGRVSKERVSLPQGRFRTLRMRLSSRCFRHVRALLDKHKPDVVFAFGLANGSLLGALACERKIPSVLFIRGMELAPQEYRHVPLGWAPVLGNLSDSVYLQLFRRYAQGIFRHATVIVFQSEAQYQAYLGQRFVGRTCRASIRFLSNNSNPSWLSQGVQPDAQGDSETIIVANLFWGKGLNVAFDAFESVRRHVPEARLTILGDGPEGEGVRRYARRIAGVTFKGHVSDVSNYFKRARLLVHPTLFELGSPNIVLEAAGWGLPMIVSDEVTHTVGHRDWVYPAHDPDRLAQLWVRALTDDSFHATLRRESREIGEQYRFDWVGKAQDILATHSRRR